MDTLGIDTIYQYDNMIAAKRASPVRPLIDRFRPLRGDFSTLFVRVRHRLLSV